jgi:hypothetical protein
MNKYEGTLVQQYQIHTDNSRTLPEYFKIYPFYRSRVCSCELYFFYADNQLRYLIVSLTYYILVSVGLSFLIS